MQINLEAIKHLGTAVVDYIRDNKSTMQTTGIVLGAVAIAVCAVVDTKNAIEKIEETKEELDTDELTTKEIIFAAAPCYIRTATAVAATCGLAVMEHRDRVKEYATAASNIALLNSAKNEYRKALSESAGEDKADEVDRKIMRDHAKQTVSELDGYYCGKSLIRDAYTGKMFWTSKATVEEAAVKVARQCHHTWSATVNDFYSFIDNNYIDTEVFSDIGWNSDHELIINDWRASQTDDGHPCLEFSYSLNPRAKWLLGC